MNEYPAVVDAIIADVADLRQAMHEADVNLCLAVEADKTARRATKEADKAYADAEAEFLAEVYIAVTESGKNAEQRKVQLDAALVKARREGVLVKSWAQMNAAKYAQEDAAMALEQAVRHFRAVEVALGATGDLARSVAPR